MMVVNFIDKIGIASNMSTKLTTSMADSLTLDLYHAARGYQGRLERHLSCLLSERHGLRLSPAQLGFLAALICGETTSSQVARRLGLSRQATHRQAAALAQAGYLVLVPDPARRNQSLIRFTPEGTALMALCRGILSGMDDAMAGDAAALRRAAGLLNAALPD